MSDLGKHSQQFARKDFAARSEHATGPDHAKLWSEGRDHRQLRGWPRGTAGKVERSRRRPELDSSEGARKLDHQGCNRQGTSFQQVTGERERWFWVGGGSRQVSEPLVRGWGGRTRHGMGVGRCGRSDRGCGGATSSMPGGRKPGQGIAMGKGWECEGFFFWFYFFLFCFLFLFCFCFFVLYNSIF